MGALAAMQICEGVVLEVDVAGERLVASKVLPVP